MKKFIFILFLSIIANCSTIKDPSFIEILDNAQHDIEVDSVKYFTGGLVFIRPVMANSKDTMYVDSIEVKRKEIQNIHKKYGLYQRNLGCTVGKQNSILAKKYEKATTAFLDKRNGKGWKQKMEKELNEID